MFNVLSGLQEGSRSVVTVNRSGPAGLVKGAVCMTTAASNTVAKADNASALFAFPFAEFVFEDLTTQQSGKYTMIYGDMEAETDQYDGTPAIGAFLMPGTTTKVGLLVAPATGASACAKVIDSYTLPINPTMTAPLGGVAVNVLRIRCI